MFTAFSALNESDGESPLGEIEPLDTSNLDPAGGGDWRELQEEALRLYQVFLTSNLFRYLWLPFFAVDLYDCKFENYKPKTELKNLALAAISFLCPSSHM